MLNRVGFYVKSQARLNQQQLWYPGIGDLQYFEIRSMIYFNINFNKLIFKKYMQYTYILD